MRFIDIDFKKLVIDGFDLNEDIIAEEVSVLSGIFKLRIDRYILIDDILEQVTEWKYATGGKTVQRGFFSPQLYETITIGGCNRGGILKKITSKSKVNYIYGFCDNCLILSQKVTDINSKPHTYEYIERRDGIEIGVEFAINRGKSDEGYKDVIRVLVAQYDNGRLINTRVLQEPTFRGKKIVDWYYSKSWYYYDEEGKLIQIENVYGIKQVMQHKKIMVICDEERCPDKYYFAEDCNKKSIYRISKNDKLYYREMFLNE